MIWPQLNSENPMETKYSSYQNPELLKMRFENGFPLLFPLDTVRVSSRWAGNGKNPLEGKVGEITRIMHGFQSCFNRDYLIVDSKSEDIHGHFESWLYPLDLVDRDETLASFILKQFGCLLYIDDRITVTNGRHSGKIGTIHSLTGYSNRLNLEIRDEAVSEKISQLYDKLHVIIDEEFQRRNTPQAFDTFVSRITDANNELYRYLEGIGKTREIYEQSLRNAIHKEESEKSTFKTKMHDLQRHSIFHCSSNTVELIERFPPNDLFVRQ